MPETRTMSSNNRGSTAAVAAATATTLANLLFVLVLFLADPHNAFQPSLTRHPTKHSAPTATTDSPERILYVSTTRRRRTHPFGVFSHSHHSSDESSSSSDEDSGFSFKSSSTTSRSSSSNNDAARDDDDNDDEDMIMTTRQHGGLSSEEYEIEERKNLTAIVEKKIRVAKAKAEIDRILQSPDAPFDVETEMQKVVQVHHEDEIENLSPSSSSSSSDLNSDSTAATTATTDEEDEMLFQKDQQEEREERIMQLEQDLYKAVKEQDYTRAADAQQKVDEMHLDDCGAVLQVNAAFYKAFSQKDYDSMQKVWLHDAASTCIHPSHRALVGSKAVLKCWKQMFDSTDFSFQRNWMEPQKISLTVKGASVAIVTCEEHVYSRRFVRGQKRQTQLVNKLLATNIFRKVAGQWYLVHHHASWHADSEPAKRALQNASLMSSSSSSSRRLETASLEGNSNTGFTSLSRKRRNLNRNRNRDRDDDDGDVDDNTDSDDNSSSSKSALDGILGTDSHGPLLGPSSNDDMAEPGQGKPTKHIIMGGSLSDILNGNLGDILSNNSKDNKSGDQNNNINDMNNGQSNNAGGGDGAFIRFERLQQAHENEDRMDQEEDDDDDDDDDEGLHVVDEGDDEDHEAVVMMKKWAETRSAMDDDDDASDDDDSSSRVAQSSSSSSSTSSPAKTDASFRQGCILALRKLCDRGAISPKQKRLLLTDIITCSAKGEFSMVEVAYELLLCTDDEDTGDEEIAGNRAIAEEEFADQCRVFATSLPEP